MAQSLVIDERSAPKVVIDPITMEVINNALVAVADEMAFTVARTARSFVLKEALDYSTALFDAKGELVAQGTCLPLHLGTMPVAVESMQREFGNDVHPGDIFATNDPYDGSSHLPDIVLVKPVFIGERLIGWSTVLAHQTDIGGRVAGGNASDSTELYQEGLRIPPTRLYDQGVPSHTLFRIIERNVRVPSLVLGDIRSQVAACSIGERGLIELAKRYGIDRFEAYCQALMDYTERFARAEIAKLPKGTYHFTDYLDGDGIVPGRITFQVAIEVCSDRIRVDFAGTSPQVKGAINSVFAFTRSATLAAVRSILPLDLPNNSGYFRAVEVTAPEGTILHPRAPAPVAARGLTGFRIADTVTGALAQIRPDLVPACGSNSPDAGVSIGGYFKDGTPFVYLEFLLASWGGGPNRDGADALTGMIINYSNSPAELVETEQPLVVERYSFVPDSGGAGRWRGGLAMDRHLRFTADEAIFQVRSDRRDVRPYGLHGGAPGAPSDVTIQRADGTEEQHPAKFLTTVRKGDLLRIRLAGAGGYGNVLEREPERVLEDVLDGKVSLAGAERDYGVVIHGTPPAIDQAATALRRKRMAQG